MKFELLSKENKMEETGFHITSVRDGSVHGHHTKHCDPVGCAGIEYYLAWIDPSEVRIGDVFQDQEKTNRS
jgi:hypothetical protein